MSDPFDADDPFAGITDPSKPEHPIPTPAPERATLHGNGLTLELDLAQLLVALDPQGRWLGYDPDADEDRFEPSSFADQIIATTSQYLVKAIRKDVIAKIEEETHTAIRAEVQQLVHDALISGTLQATNQWGRPEGEPKPLTEVILGTAEAVLRQKVGDSYSRTPQRTLLQQMVADEVGAAFKKDLTAAVAEAKQAALEAVRNSASEVITETIARSVRTV